MAAVLEMARVTSDVDSVPDDPRTDTQKTESAVYQYIRRRAMEGGMAEDHEGIPGWLWEGSVGSVVGFLWPAMESRELSAMANLVRSRLGRRGACVCVAPGAAGKSLWWIADSPPSRPVAPPKRSTPKAKPAPRPVRHASGTIDPTRDPRAAGIACYEWLRQRGRSGGKAWRVEDQPGWVVSVAPGAAVRDLWPELGASARARVTDLTRSFFRHRGVARMVQGKWWIAEDGDAAVRRPYRPIKRPAAAAEPPAAVEPPAVVVEEPQAVETAAEGPAKPPGGFDKLMDWLRQERETRESPPVDPPSFDPPAAEDQEDQEDAPPSGYGDRYADLFNRPKFDPPSFDPPAAEDQEDQEDAPPSGDLGPCYACAENAFRKARETGPLIDDLIRENGALRADLAALRAQLERGQRAASYLTSLMSTGC